MFENNKLRSDFSAQGIFRGVHPENLPEFMQHRLQPFFQASFDLYKQQSTAGQAPHWCILITAEKSNSGGKFEWADYQHDHGIALKFNPECYGYSDGKLDYFVSVVSKENNRHDLGCALRLFEFLAKDADKFVSNSEDVANMASYSIYRGYRYL